jgi:hypothetical protein
MTGYMFHLYAKDVPAEARVLVMQLYQYCRACVLYAEFVNVVIEPAMTARR